LVTKYTDRIFSAKIGITQSKFMVLSAIESFQSPVHQIRIAEKVQRNSNSLSTMADRLVKSGLVVRTRSSEDHREVRLSLTTEGKKKVTQGKKVNETLNKQLVGMLGEKESQGLQDTLSILEERIINEIK
jgi:DNA-binding MarR family transcriptional regulator